MPFRTEGGILVPAMTAEQMREVDRIAVEAFGLGVALLLVALAPGMSPNPATAVAWLVTALAFLAPLPHLPQRIRAGLLLAAALFALLGVLAAAGIVPKPLLWLSLAAAFHLAIQVWSSRPAARTCWKRAKRGNRRRPSSRASIRTAPFERSPAAARPAKHAYNSPTQTTPTLA